ncbi:MAG TPA: DUF1080 domain-containing protein [Gemmataceae bacterium]|jgi:hypothetical protein|nr:DUF1080 domain-containing protein [Gemmataceae bacterium]
MLRWLLPTFALAIFASATIADDVPVLSPKDDPIVLFNGKDLTNFYTYLGPPQGKKEPLGKNNDPLKVVNVVEEDGKPAIRVSGEVMGYFATEREFENFHLIVEFKWGTKTFPPRETKGRDSGVFVNCNGPDGAVGGLWMAGIEHQVMEGATGDLILVGGKDKGHKFTATVRKDGNKWYYDPKGEPREFNGGMINWFAHDPDWKDTLGFRGKNDVEKPAGEWNTIECICAGDTITNVLNGKLVNNATNVNPRKGKLLFQSEGAEIFFRKIELKPVEK